jgi:hypothetical protein
MARNNPALAIQTHFATLKDPRIDRTRLHDLLDIVVIALCAVICGAEGWEDIAKYGRSKQDWLQTFLRLPNAAFAATKEDKAQKAFCLQNGVTQAPFWSRTPWPRRTLSSSSSLLPSSPFSAAMIE